MRKFALCLPIIALSACSALEQPFLKSANGSASGHYNQGCVPVSCATGYGYSAAGAPHQSYYQQGGFQHDFHQHNGHHQGGYNLNGGAGYWPDTGLVPAYESASPVHVNPTRLRIWSAPAIARHVRTKVWSCLRHARRRYV